MLVVLTSCSLVISVVVILEQAVGHQGFNRWTCACDLLEILELNGYLR